MGSLRIRSESSKRAEEQGGRARRRRGIACVLAHSELCQATKLGHSAEFQARGSGIYAGCFAGFGYGPSKDWVIEEKNAEIAKLQKEKAELEQKTGDADKKKTADPGDGEPKVN